MIWQTSSTSSDDTVRLGELLGSQLNGGEVIELRSDLGGGKTTLVQGLATGAGSSDRVSSPTFTLNRIYNAKKLVIAHFDFYRLTDPGLLADQLSEAIAEQNIVIVEWADVVSNVLPTDRLTIELKPTANSPDERIVSIYYPETYQRIIRTLEIEYARAKS